MSQKTQAFIKKAGRTRVNPIAFSKTAALRHPAALHQRPLEILTLGNPVRQGRSLFFALPLGADRYT